MATQHTRKEDLARVRERLALALINDNKNEATSAFKAAHTLVRKHKFGFDEIFTTTTGQALSLADIVRAVDKTKEVGDKGKELLEKARQVMGDQDVRTTLTAALEIGKGVAGVMRKFKGRKAG